MSAARLAEKGGVQAQGHRRQQQAHLVVNGERARVRLRTARPRRRPHHLSHQAEVEHAHRQRNPKGRPPSRGGTGHLRFFQNGPCIGLGRWARPGYQQTGERQQGQQGLRDEDRRPWQQHEHEKAHGREGPGKRHGEHDRALVQTGEQADPRRHEHHGAEEHGHRHPQKEHRDHLRIRGGEPGERGDGGPCRRNQRGCHKRASFRKQAVEAPVEKRRDHPAGGCQQRDGDHGVVEREGRAVGEEEQSGRARMHGKP